MEEFFQGEVRDLYKFVSFAGKFEGLGGFDTNLDRFEDGVFFGWNFMNSFKR